MRKLRNKSTMTFMLLSVANASFYFFSTNRTPVSTTSAHIAQHDTSSAERNPYLHQLANAYDSAFRQLLQQHHTPGAAVVVVYDSTIVLLKGYGVKQRGRPDSVDVHTVFRLASVSKPFASFLTGILVDEKKLNWNDTVANLWPGFRLQSPYQTRQITLRHVLSHTTGLPYHTYTNMIEKGLPADTLLALLREVELASKPGELYSYQNVGYSVIGKVIEQVSGKTYQQVLDEKVFIPLNMNDASTSYLDLLSSGNMAHPHVFKRGQLQPTLVNDTYYNVSPAGGINASIDDMAKWLVAVLGNKPHLVSKATLHTLFTPVVLANSRNRNFYKWQRVQQAHYALGWRVLRFASDTLVYHGGYVAGYRSEVAIHPSEKVAVCVLTNAPGTLADTCLPLFFKIFDRYQHSLKTWHPILHHKPNL